ncbi:ATP-binding cassette domain-containing protein, partial [Streptomyces massasporeus]
FQRPREVGPAADVFALGSVLVHAATGHGPFDSDSPYIVAYQVVHDEPDLTGVPAELAPLVARCLAKEPGERPTPAQIMSALLPPSYAAEAFIPAQRRRPALPHGEERAHGEPGRAPAWDADTPVRATAPAPPRRGPRLGRVRLRPRLTLAVAAALALTGAGLYAALSRPADGVSERPARPDEVATAFTGWHTTLQMHGPTAAPACTHGGGALYCAARGVGLARLDPVTGKVVWSRTGPVEAESPVAPFLLADGLVGAAAPADPLRAHAAADGAPLWTAGPSRPPELYAPAGSAVVLTDGRGGVRAVGSRPDGPARRPARRRRPAPPAPPGRRARRGARPGPRRPRRPDRRRTPGHPRRRPHRPHRRPVLPLADAPPPGRGVPVTELRLHGLSYENRLRSVDLTVRPGETVGLIGPNGSGKTTLLRCVYGTLTPTAGRALLDGDDLHALGPKARAR